MGVYLLLYLINIIILTATTKGSLHFSPLDQIMPIIFCPTTKGLSFDIVSYYRVIGLVDPTSSLNDIIILSFLPPTESIETMTDAWASFKSINKCPLINSLQIKEVGTLRDNGADHSFRIGQHLMHIQDSIIAQASFCVVMFDQSKPLPSISIMDSMYPIKILAKFSEFFSHTKGLKQSATNPFANLLVIFSLVRALAFLFCPIKRVPATVSARLYNASAIYRQCCFRLQQVFISNVLTQFTHKGHEDNIEALIRQYNLFTTSQPNFDSRKALNYSLASIVDVCIGIFVGILLLWSSGNTYNFFAQLNHSLEKCVEKWVEWLMGWPAGLKLNGNLAKFLGELFLWILSLWSMLINKTMSFSPHICISIGLVSTLGISFAFAAIFDLVSFITTQLLFFHFVSTRLFGWGVRLLLSLFHLFHGKKHNILRRRIDSATYSADQLLLGTVLLALSFFIFPTLAVYFLLFFFFYLVVHIFRMLMETCLAIFNTMPLYELCMLVFAPQLVPGKLYLEEIHSSPPVFEVKVDPITLQAIFEDLMNRPIKIFGAYFQTNSISQLCSGHILSRNIDACYKFLKFDDFGLEIKSFFDGIVADQT